ncbi:MAG: hypothetical protein KJ069_18455 [Anaerolineae bacterium]|nr:hypothetical protein [Anaerolineae bacterium]
MFDTQQRYGHTGKKMITLTHEGREQIQTFADAHGMNFSAAIETLALIGMKADLTALLIPLLREVVDKAMQRNFNRLAKLSLLAAAEATMAHDLTTMLLLQVVRQEAARHPADFETRMGVSYDPADQPDARIRSLYDHIRHIARQRQQRLLKRPLAQLVTELATALAVNDGDVPEGEYNEEADE